MISLLNKLYRLILIFDTNMIILNANPHCNFQVVVGLYQNLSPLAWVPTIGFLGLGFELLGHETYGVLDILSQRLAQLRWAGVGRGLCPCTPYWARFRLGLSSVRPFFLTF